MPPPGQCLRWVGELEAIFARELLLKTALVDGISHDTEHTQQVPPRGTPRSSQSVSHYHTPSRELMTHTLTLDR